MQDEVKRITFGAKLKETVHAKFSEEQVISLYLSWLEKRNT
jgi:hypothetical protein